MQNAQKRVLVVDDEVHILHVLSLKLRNAGYQVLTAQDGREALEVAQVEQPNLLITDYQMPFLSGIELCQRLRQIPSTSRIPAIMLTARGFAVDSRAAAATGIRASLNKPFSPNEVLKVVESILVTEAVA